jgi:hypothetical protein
MKVPCEDCLIIPICIHEGWMEVLSKCSLIRKHIRDEVRHYAITRSKNDELTEKFTIYIKPDIINKYFWIKTTKGLITITDRIEDSFINNYVMVRYGEEKMREDYGNPM